MTVAISAGSAAATVLAGRAAALTRMSIRGPMTAKAAAMEAGSARSQGSTVASAPAARTRAATS